MKKLLYFTALLICISPLYGCRDLTLRTTSLKVEDNNRHYYPILRGQQLDVEFTITNTGDHPFVLSEILISCGCIVEKKSSINTIPAGGERKLVLTFDSSKNIGYVQHFIEIYGNFEEDVDKMTLVFDTNVVPESAYTKDYEELYKELRSKYGDFKGFTDGEEHNRGYYMDGDF